MARIRRADIEALLSKPSPKAAVWGFQANALGQGLDSALAGNHSKRQRWVRGLLKTSSADTFTTRQQSVWYRGIPRKTHRVVIISELNGADVYHYFPKGGEHGPIAKLWKSYGEGTTPPLKKGKKHARTNSRPTMEATMSERRSAKELLGATHAMTGISWYHKETDKKLAHLSYATLKLTVMPRVSKAFEKLIRADATQYKKGQVHTNPSGQSTTWGHELKEATPDRQVQLIETLVSHLDEARMSKSEFAKECRRRRDHGLVLSGNTYPIKEKIKAQGGIWDSRLRAWLVPDVTVMNKLDSLMSGSSRSSSRTSSWDASDAAATSVAAGSGASRSTIKTRAGGCAECGASLQGRGRSTLRHDSSGLPGYVCRRCSSTSSYELSFA